MNFKKLVSVIAAVTICAAATGCASSDSSSSKADTSSAAQTTTTAPAATTDYDINGDFRAYDQLKEAYADGYTIVFSNEVDGQKTDYTMCVKDDKAYVASVISGMKSYRVAPGDGKVYIVSEATTTYSTQEQNDDFVRNSDMLFGATTDFDKAEIDADTNTVKEYYKLDEELVGGTGSIIYSFDGETYDLKSLTVAFDGSDVIEYTLTSIAAADETLLAVPDLSGYTDQTQTAE